MNLKDAMLSEKNQSERGFFFQKWPSSRRAFEPLSFLSPQCPPEMAECLRRRARIRGPPVSRVTAPKITDYITGLRWRISLLVGCEPPMKNTELTFTVFSEGRTHILQGNSVEGRFGDYGSAPIRITSMREWQSSTQVLLCDAHYSS